MSNGLPKVVIVGGGFGGIETAKELRHASPLLRKQKNATVLMEEVRAIDTTKRRVETHSVSMPYDYLVLATGAAHSYFGHDEWPKLLLASNALKTLPGYDGASSSPSSARSFPWTKPSVSASSHS
jgi:NADH dehydrogenase FAD-containing subunit